MLGAIISGVSNIATSLINRHSQKETNKANARLNQENNEFNAEQSKLQRDWSAEEAEKARQFDTSERLAQQDWQEKMADPRLQMQKWLDAGLSPNTFSGDLSVGSANGSSVGIPSGSAASAPSPIGMRAPVLDLDMSQTALNLAQAKAINDANDRENQKQGLVLDTASLQLELIDSQINLNKSLSESEKQKIAESGKRIEEMDSVINHNKAVTILAELEGDEKRKNLDYLDDFLQTNLAQAKLGLELSKSQIKQISSQVVLNFANAGLANANKDLAEANTNVTNDVHYLNGVQISGLKGHEDEIAKFIWDDTKGQYKLSIRQTKVQNRKAGFRAEGGFFNDVLDFGEILGESVGAGLKGIVKISAK